MKRYKHGMTQARRDWTIIILLYLLIATMIFCADLAIKNYVLTGHQCREGNFNDGTTQQGDSSQGDSTTNS